MQARIADSRDDLLAAVFLGHGYREGIAIREPAEHRAGTDELLTPRDLAHALDGVPLPYAFFYSCDQGGPQGEEWQRATRAQRMLTFDGSASVEDISNYYLERIDEIPCSATKPVCIE
ncbi:MAG: hypothetical protein AAGC55_09935 [Myxococcota bacterium]